MNPNDYRNLLDPQDFQEIFQFWDPLSPSEKNHLLSQLDSIDWNLLKLQKKILTNQLDTQFEYEPFLDFFYAGNQEDQKNGLQKIAKGELGCLILSGGQGSRLNSKLPKGLHPVSIIQNKSLFQIFSEKTLSAQKWAGHPLQLAIMVSPYNEKIIKQFFSDHHFFGLNPNQISFFTQKTLPLLDSSGNLFLENPSQIAMGPNGNGFALKEFVDSGIWSKWHQQGVRYLNIIPIDNVLADPFDAELLGFHCKKGLEITSKSIEKKSPDEKVGVFVKEAESVRVIEYSEMEEKSALHSDGKLKHRCASIGLFCLSMDFILNISKKDDLPLHQAWKAVDKLYHDGMTHHTSRPNAWKFETFIFDVIRYTNRIATLLYPREECFAPLKNGSGENSLETVQNALLRRDREIIKNLTGRDPPLFPFELATDFYYPTSELIAKWKNKEIKTEYVTP